MKHTISLVLGIAVLVSACAARNGGDVGVTHTTSADPNQSCLHNDLDCEQNSDCCSFWCVNGQCELREP